MAVDYAHPVLTDVYAASGGAPDWPSYIRDNFTAMGTMFEGLDPAGKTVGFKRVTAGGLFQRWNGTAWVNFPLGYFSSTGGNITGPVNITSPTANQFSILSGSATVNAFMSIGRTTAEMYFGVAGQNSGLTIGDTPGDVSLRTENGRLFFSHGSTGLGGFKDGNFAIGHMAPTVKVDVWGTAPAGSTVGIRLREMAGDHSAQLLVTHPGFLYAGVPGGAAWLYSSGTTPLYLGPDGTGDIAFVGGGIVRASIKGTNGYATFAGAVHVAGNVVGNAALNGMQFGLSANQPSVLWHYAAGALNAKAWDMYAGPDSLVARCINDAFTDARTWLQVTRAGFAVANVQFPAGYVGIGRTPVKQLEVNGTTSSGFSGSSEAFRVVNDGGHISFWPTNESARTGYIQFMSSGSTAINCEKAGATMVVYCGGVHVATFHSDGNMYKAGIVTAGTRFVTANEVGSGSTAGVVLPGGARMQWGTVTTTLGAGAVVTFPSAFSTFINLQATLNGGSGTGWVLRTFNPSTTTFQFNMDNWNTAGMGNTAYIWWFAIGT